MKGKTAAITRWLLLVSAVVLIGWDIYVATNEAKEDTISEIAYIFFHTHPLSVATFFFALGYVSGHLSWAQTFYVWINEEGRVLRVTKTPPSEKVMG